jgi:hypothetical protein
MEDLELNEREQMREAIIESSRDMAIATFNFWFGDRHELPASLELDDEYRDALIRMHRLEASMSNLVANDERTADQIQALVYVAKAQHLLAGVVVAREQGLL